jgi:hypothetical protein
VFAAFERGVTVARILDRPEIAIERRGGGIGRQAEALIQLLAAGRARQKR